MTSISFGWQAIACIEEIQQRYSEAVRDLNLRWTPSATSEAILGVCRWREGHTTYECNIRLAAVEQSAERKALKLEEIDIVVTPTITLPPPEEIRMLIRATARILE